METSKLKHIVEAFNGARIAVVGDFFLDKILRIDPELNEPSVETNLTAYQITQKILEPGAAGTITNNLSCLKVGKIYAVGAIGKDGEGFELINRLKEQGIDDTFLLQNQKWVTPSYIKPFLKFEDRLEEINRLDVKNRTTLPPEIETILVQNLYDVSNRVDAIIILDQLGIEKTGVITPAVIEALSDIAQTNPHIHMVVDTRTRPFSFKNILLKCNHLEAIKAVSPDYTGQIDMDIIKHCAEVMHKNTGKSVLITCGERGITVLDDNRFQLIPSVQVDGEIDICGAGDAATAGLVSALCASADLFEAALIGNLAASVTIKQIGKTGVASQEDIKRAWQSYTQRGNES